jgi:serine/threonine protein kinase
MLSGRMPFQGKKVAELNRLGAVKFPFKYWKDVHPDAVKFVRRLMEVNPINRPTAT